MATEKKKKRRRTEVRPSGTISRASWTKFLSCKQTIKSVNWFNYCSGTFWSRFCWSAAVVSVELRNLKRWWEIDNEESHFYQLSSRPIRRFQGRRIYLKLAQSQSNCHDCHRPSLFVALHNMRRDIEQSHVTTQAILVKGLICLLTCLSSQNGFNSISNSAAVAFYSVQVHWNVNSR